MPLVPIPAPSPASTSRRTLSSESKGDSDMDVLSPLPSPVLTSEALAEAEAAQQAVPGAGGGLGYLGQEKELRKALAMCGDFLKDMQDAMKALKVAPTMVRCREWWRSRVWESEATTDFASAPGPAGSPAKDAAEELKETDIEPVQAQQRQLKEDTNKLVALQLSGPNLTVCYGSLIHPLSSSYLTQRTSFLPLSSFTLPSFFILPSFSASSSPPASGRAGYEPGGLAGSKFHGTGS